MNHTVLSTEAVKHQSFGAIDFDIIRGRTSAWIIRIGTDVKSVLSASIAFPV